MNKKDEEQRIFDMAKQDVSYLKHLDFVKHDDRPDFILKDKKANLIIGLEHFRADVYRVQDTSSSHISGGHTVLKNSLDKAFQKYNSYVVSNTLSTEITKQAAKEVFEIALDSFIMQSRYTYEAFLDNLRVAIHGRPPRVKGHIQKSKNYPNRGNYDLMGFLIEVPVPSFDYYFETDCSQKFSQIQSLLYKPPLNLQGFTPLKRQFCDAYSYQKINGLPITKEIWRELNIFEDIDFVIIETYDENYPTEHHGQYFDKNTPKPHIYPAFSFGFTNMIFTDVQTEHKNGKINAIFNSHTKYSKYNVTLTKTTLKAERRKLNRKSKKHFDEATRKFRNKM